MHADLDVKVQACVEKEKNRIGKTPISVLSPGNTRNIMSILCIESHALDQAASCSDHPKLC